MVTDNYLSTRVSLHTTKPRKTMTYQFNSIVAVSLEERLFSKAYYHDDSDFFEKFILVRNPCGKSFIMMCFWSQIVFDL